MVNDLPLKYETIEGHIQKIECLSGNGKGHISNLEIKTKEGSLMKVTFPMALPFEKDDRIKAYIDMRTDNNGAAYFLKCSYKDKLSNKEEAFRIEKIKNWNVAVVYIVNTKEDYLKI